MKDFRITMFEEVLDDVKTNGMQSKYATKVGNCTVINLMDFFNEKHYPQSIRWYFENKTVCFDPDTNFIIVYYAPTNKLIEAIENGNNEKIVSFSINYDDFTTKPFIFKAIYND